MSDVQSSHDLPVFLFHQGTNYRSYELLGCQFDSKTETAVFRTWAPSAKSIQLVGDFNDWDETACPMSRISDGGVWEASVSGVRQGHRYKYAITSGRDGRVLKADPYAFFSETDNRTASIVYDLSGYKWNDDAWRNDPRRTISYDCPMNVYEVHAGSWRRAPDGQPLSYVELAKQLIPYVKEMNYTHIELMPVI